MQQYLNHFTFKVIVIEQADALPFNRGSLLNVGFQLSSHDANWLVFHDVDMLPISADCDYTRPLAVSHISSRVEQFAFTLPYRNYLGGIVTCTPEAFSALNGFSNKYAGWGCEDDDLFIRCMIADIRIERRDGVFKSLHHTRSSRIAANDKQLARMINRCFSGEDVGLDHIDARLFRRVDPKLFVMNAEVARDHVNGDGITTLQYVVRNRCSLRERLYPLTEVEEKHEIVSVTLGEQ